MDPTARLQFTKCEIEIRHYRRFADVGLHPAAEQKGITTLYCSASGQFGEQHIQRIVDKAKEVCKDLSELWFIDLRAERHVFINGKPAVWKAEQEKAAETAETILKDENEHIAQIGKKILIGDVSVDVEKVVSEQDLVKSYGYQYARFPMVEHECPTVECVDNLVKFILQHPNAWMHFHCYVTKRSTTALAMADMVYNASEIDLKSILDRLRMIGGSDLMKIPDTSSNKHAGARQLVKFLQDFHRYCRAENPMHNPKAKIWSEWIKQ
jgi:hypothetical protein